MDDKGESPDGSVSSNTEGEPISKGRRSRDPARQTPRRRSNQSEGAEGSLITRQIRKRSTNNSRSRERSVIMSRPQDSKISKVTLSHNNEAGRSRPRVRRREKPRQSRKRYRNRSRSYSRLNVSSSDEAYDARGTRRYRRSSIDSYDSPVKRLIKRRRSREPSRHSHHKLPSGCKDLPINDLNILHKFLDVLTNVKGSSNSKLSLTNVVPEFDPMCKDQTIINWLTKVEECAEIYNWNEREIIHFAIPKLTGVAKLWYQGLNSVLYSWTEWKRKLIESFPCRQDYAELLGDMLAKRARYGESLDQYYYAKINLINRCSISGRNAVDCLLHGVDDRAVRVGAQAARFRTPEDVLKYFKTVKSSSKEQSDKPARDRKFDRNHDKNRVEETEKGGWSSNNIKCHNCNEEGHKSFICKKPPNKCHACNKSGHLDIYCRLKTTNKPRNAESCNNETIVEFVQ